MNGYTVIYLDKRDRVHCAACATDDTVPHAYPEGPALECESCGTVIESDYGDPEGGA